MAEIILCGFVLIGAAYLLAILFSLISTLYHMSQAGRP